MIAEGQRFPDFSLYDQDGNLHSLGDMKGKTFVVYFYPKDDTSGCTVEAKEFNDALPLFSGVKIFGVSPDAVKSHKKFADKFGLQFTLLSDPDQTLCNAVGVWVEKSLYGRKYMGVERSTFIIDGNGFVQKVFAKVKPEGHAAKVAAAATS